MEFDWNNPAFKLDGDIKAQDVEESFEDPFVVRLMPESPRFAKKARFFNLGRASNGEGIFSIYRTNGKQVRVIGSRLFEPEEMFFYKRRMKQLLD